MNRSHTEIDACYCVATPPGRSAVATIITHGPGTIDCLNRLFRPRNAGIQLRNQIGKIVYGNWLVADELGEDLVVCVKSDQHLEIHCHGGKAALEIISDSLKILGVNKVSVKQMAACISGSEYAAELNLSICNAQTERTATHLLAQPKLHRLMWTRIESALDRNSMDDLRSEVEGFLKWQEFGRRLTLPANVVFCGSPNVGKSSLVNTILGFQRAIVHSEAGTTRDAINERTALNGWPVQLFDTAGVRETEDEIEQLGIAGAEETIRSGDVVVLVVDASSIDNELIEKQIGEFCPLLVVANKCDLMRCTHPNVDFEVSAATGFEIDQLIERIRRLLIREVPDSTQAVPVSAMQIALIKDVIAAAEVEDWHSARMHVPRF